MKREALKKLREALNLSNQTPIESQVAKYFENLGNQQGLSTQLENDYNTAKTNVQNTLNITPLENQFPLMLNMSIG